MELLTLEEALELFKLPRVVGTFEDKEVVAAIGRFGPYLRHDGKFYSLKKEYDPHTVSEEDAIIVIEAKRVADAEKFIKVFDEDKVYALVWYWALLPKPGVAYHAEVGDVLW